MFHHLFLTKNPIQRNFLRGNWKVRYELCYLRTQSITLLIHINRCAGSLHSLFILVSAAGEFYVCTVVDARCLSIRCLYLSCLLRSKGISKLEIDACKELANSPFHTTFFHLPLALSNRFLLAPILGETFLALEHQNNHRVVN